MSFRPPHRYRTAERGEISPSTARAYDRYLSQRGDVESARFGMAADIAGRAVGQAHAYTRARLFAYQATALAAGDHPDEARDALAEMREHIIDIPPMLGAALFDDGSQVLYSAQTLADIGGRDAESLAREAIAGYPADQQTNTRLTGWRGS